MHLIVAQPEHEVIHSGARCRLYEHSELVFIRCISACIAIVLSSLKCACCAVCIGYLHCHTVPLRSSDSEKLGYKQRMHPHQHQQDADCDVFGVLGGLDLSETAETAPASSSSAPVFATGVAPTADRSAQPSASSASTAGARPGGSAKVQQLMTSGNSSGALAAAAAAAAAQHNFAPNQAQAAQQAALLQQRSADMNASQVRHMLRRSICCAARSQGPMLFSRYSAEIYCAVSREHRALGLQVEKRYVHIPQLSLQAAHQCLWLDSAFELARLVRCQWLPGCA